MKFKDHGIAIFFFVFFVTLLSLEPILAQRNLHRSDMTEEVGIKVAIRIPPQKYPSHPVCGRQARTKRRFRTDETSTPTTNAKNNHHSMDVGTGPAPALSGATSCPTLLRSVWVYDQVPRCAYRMPLLTPITAAAVDKRNRGDDSSVHHRAVDAVRHSRTVSQIIQRARPSPNTFAEPEFNSIHGAARI